MALDGLVIANLAWELSRALTGGRISKIYQPESDALVLTVKNNRENYRLLLSANASLPLVYLTEDTPSNPAAAPNFCMLLRKHIGGGKILSVTQPGMERILHFEIEHLDEMGDLQTKLLIVELMGKHSNIIFCQPDLTIIDSIKHISAYISSVREVLPGRPYFIAETQKKYDPWTLGREAFTGLQEECGQEEAEAASEALQPVLERPASAAKAIYTAITGISPLIAEEICCRAGIDSSQSTSSLTQAERLHLYGTFERLMDELREHAFVPNIVYDGSDAPVEFSCVPLHCYDEMRREEYASISEVLVRYYAAKNAVTRMRQKSSDLRGIVKTLLERCRKKYSLQQKQMADTEKKDKYRIYGEMINTYGYEVEPGAKVLACVNYYDGKEIKVPLDPTLSPHENSLKYFDRYAKLKRTADALKDQIEETRAELEHLESIQTALEMAPDEAALSQVKEELVSFGFIKGHGSLQDRTGRRQNGRGAGGVKQRPGKQKNKQARSKSKPYHYISGDGYDIYVGKNNFQNEEITFSLADGSDWWFHAKGMPGSHVIVKARGEELPDNTFEEAGRLAAYYSKGREAEKVEIDYIQKKHVKKTPGGRPGFVIYHTNYSMVSKPDIEGIREI